MENSTMTAEDMGFGPGLWPEEWADWAIRNLPGINGGIVYLLADVRDGKRCMTAAIYDEASVALRLSGAYR